MRDIIARYNIRTRKSHGQHFLHDLNLTDRIARASGPLEDCRVLEVGAGPGGLTRSLLEAGAKEVVAVETDPRCIEALQELAMRFEDQLTIWAEDALKTPAASFAQLRENGKIRIIGNLPYNISTALLTKWLHIEFEAPTFESMTLMFQKEVAERLVAGPGSKSYGRLSILCGWMAECRMLFDVAPKAFVPAPKVTSTVVELVPRATRESQIDIRSLEQVTRAAFGQRRKMLRSSLRSLELDAPRMLSNAGISGDRRAEELSVSEFCSLTSAFEAIGAEEGRPPVS